ncbi:hypothetical protein [Rhizobium miluonense]
MPPGFPVELAFEGSIAQFSKTVEERRTGQGVLGLASSEAGGTNY